MTDLLESHDHPQDGARKHRQSKLAVIGATLLVLGGAAGAAVVSQTRPAVTMAPTTPVAIRSLTSGNIVTIRGHVAEIYGNKFIVADASGRALVDAGPEGDDRALVTAGEPVMVQGRFESGLVHAAFLVGPDKKVLALGPLDRPHGPPRGPHGPDGGPGGPDGPPPPGDRDAAPPPPPPASGAAPVANRATVAPVAPTGA